MAPYTVSLKIEFVCRCQPPVIDKQRKSSSGCEPCDPTFVLSRSGSNIICSVLFGSRFDYDDERLLTIIRLTNNNFQIMSSPRGETPFVLLQNPPTLSGPQLYDIFPSLLDWVSGPHQRIFQNFKCLRDLIAHSVHDHQASLDPRSPRDFIDCFLTKMAEEKEEPLSHFHVDTLLMTTHNLLFGGTETVGTTLRHAFLALMKYLKVQDEAHPHSSAEVPMCSSLTPEQGATAPPPAPPPRSDIASCWHQDSTAKPTNPHGGRSHHMAHEVHAACPNPDPDPTRLIVGFFVFVLFFGDGVSLCH
ncbi:cytochrome P450 2F5-like, partial [Hylobates moloch]|uniref:cytochrome P450 2F5-like n=1 Tax=Hylobates moloch TaxID=81572 RepID=UPI0026768044